MVGGYDPKKVSRFDVKALKNYTEQEAVNVLFSMSQGATEATDCFILHVKINAQTLKLAGGEHFIYNPTDIVTVDANNVTDEEKILRLRSTYQC